jgi:hypothetical protein
VECNLLALKRVILSQRSVGTTANADMSYRKNATEWEWSWSAIVDAMIAHGVCGAWLVWEAGTEANNMTAMYGRHCCDCAI